MFSEKNTSIIQSTANPAFRKLLALQTARGIRQHGEFLIAGPKLVQDALSVRSNAISAWITTPVLPPIPSTLKNARQILLSKQLFNAVNIFGAPGNLLCMRTPVLPTFDPARPWPDGCTLLIPFSDPENVGTALRAAAALGAARVVLLREAACPFLPKAIRASAGAIWKITPQLGPALADLDGIPETRLFVLDMDGKPIETIKPPQAYALVAGAEGQGLPEKLLRRGQRISIKMTAAVESLNAATATAIALWAWRKTS